MVGRVALRDRVPTSITKAGPPCLPGVTVEAQRP